MGEIEEEEEEEDRKRELAGSTADNLVDVVFEDVGFSSSTRRTSILVDLWLTSG